MAPAYLARNLFTTRVTTSASAGLLQGKKMFTRVHSTNKSGCLPLMWDFRETLLPPQAIGLSGRQVSHRDDLQLVKPDPFLQQLLP